MKRRKKLLCIVLVFSITFQIIGMLNMHNTYASETITVSTLAPKVSLNILEIVSGGTSELEDNKSNITGYSDVTLTTMNMKQFVAMREALNGKYDIIYIGVGKGVTGNIYSKTALNCDVQLDSNAINQGNFEGIGNILDYANDITTLKYDEIKTFISDPNNIIIFNNSIKTKATDSDKLIHLYDALDATKDTEDNIIKIQLSDVASEINKEYLRNKVALHPKFTISESSKLSETVAINGIKNIKVSVSEEYSNYLKEKGHKQIHLYLYVDKDNDCTFETQVAGPVALPLATNTSTISYKPSGYYRYENIKLCANIDGLNTKSYVNDVFIYQGNPKEVKVLQVLGQLSNTVDDFTFDSKYNITVDQVSVAKDTGTTAAIFPYSSNKQAIINQINTYVNTYSILFFGLEEGRFIEHTASSFGGVHHGSALALPDGGTTTSYDEFYAQWLSYLISTFEANNKGVLYTKDMYYPNETRPIGTAFKNALNKQGQNYIIDSSSNPIQFNSSSNISAFEINKGVINKQINPINPSALKIIELNNYGRLDLEKEDVVVWYAASYKDAYDSWDFYHTYSFGNNIVSNVGASDIKLLQNILFMMAQNIDTTSATNETLNILEINDTGVSDLKPLAAASPNVHIDYLTMKAFVALRQQLDGKYDIVYIGKGVYCPDVLADQGEASNPQTSNDTRFTAHDTNVLMNDITHLKAAELKAYVANHQVKLIVDSSIYDQASTINAVEYRKTGSASDYKTVALKWYNNTKGSWENKTSSAYANKIPTTQAPILKTAFVGLSSDYFKTTTGAIKAWSEIINTKSDRPLFTLSDKPDEFTSSTAYKEGEFLKFSYCLTDSNGTEQTTLYFDDNYDNRYDAEEIKVGPIPASGALQYLLPKGFSGIRLWKLELTREVTINGVKATKKSYQTGIIKFEGQTVKVRVLQLGSDKSNINDSLLDSDVMKQDKFTSKNNYNITIDYMTVSAFNNKYASLAVLDSKKVEETYKQLSAQYDMLLFGFADTYGTLTDVNNGAAAIIQKFIDTEQSVMFTHDVFQKTTSNWFKHFGTQLGIGSTIHGLSANSNIARGGAGETLYTVLTNSGLISEYPYNLPSVMQLGVTHDQFYTLNLENPDVVVWYNMIRDYNLSDMGNSDADNYNKYYQTNLIDSDSWHHYYTYSVNNITYSGTGHSFAKNNYTPELSEQEQQFFINTMYKAFTGANHRPIIRINEGEDYNLKDPKSEEETDDAKIVEISAPVLIKNNQFTLNYTPNDYDSNKKLTVDLCTYDGIAELSADGTINETKLGTKKTDLLTNGKCTADTLLSQLITADASDLDFVIVIKVTDKEGTGITETKYINVHPDGLMITPSFGINLKDKTPHTIKVIAIYPTGTGVTYSFKNPTQNIISATQNGNTFEVTAQNLGKVEVIATLPDGSYGDSCIVTVYDGGFISPVKATKATIKEAIKITSEHLSSSAHATGSPTFNDYNLVLSVTSNTFDYPVKVKILEIKLGSALTLKLDVNNNAATLSYAGIIDSPIPLYNVGNTYTFKLPATAMSCYMASENALDTEINVIAVDYNTTLSLKDYKDTFVKNGEHIDFNLLLTCIKEETIEDIDASGNPKGSYHTSTTNITLTTEDAYTAFNYISIPKIQ